MSGGLRGQMRLIEIGLGMRMVGNEFRYGWQNDDNFWLWFWKEFGLVWNVFINISGKIHTQNDGTDYIQLFWLVASPNIYIKTLFWVYVVENPENPGSLTRRHKYICTPVATGLFFSALPLGAPGHRPACIFGAPMQAPHLQQGGQQAVGQWYRKTCFFTSPGRQISQFQNPWESYIR